MRRRKLKILRAHSGFEVLLVLIQATILVPGTTIYVSLAPHCVCSPFRKARHEW